MEAGRGFTCAGIGSGSRAAAPPASTGLSSQIPRQPPPAPTTSPPPPACCWSSFSDGVSPGSSRPCWISEASRFGGDGVGGRLDLVGLQLQVDSAAPRRVGEGTWCCGRRGEKSSRGRRGHEGYRQSQKQISLRSYGLKKTHVRFAQANRHRS